MKLDKLAGLTLIESLVVLAVLSVLLVVSQPNISGFGQRVILSSYSNRFLFAVFLARSEAIKRNSRVVVCKSGDGRSCNPYGDWSQGWIVFNDPNNNAQFDSGEELLLVEAALRPGWTMFGNYHVAHYVSYTGSGSSKTLSGASQAGRIYTCKMSDQPVLASEIVINFAGRPRTARTQLTSCPF